MLELSNSSLPDEFADTAVAIGKFDGIHLGHQQLFHELVHFSEEAGLAAAVLTFDRHPDAFLKPGTEPSAIIGPIQKARILESLGADALITLRFDQQLANLSPEQFVVKHLMPIRAKLVWLGKGFVLGTREPEASLSFGNLVNASASRLRRFPRWFLATSRFRVLR